MLKTAIENGLFQRTLKQDHSLGLYKTDRKVCTVHRIVARVDTRGNHMVVQQSRIEK